MNTIEEAANTFIDMFSDSYEPDFVMWKNNGDTITVVGAKKFNKILDKEIKHTNFMGYKVVFKQ